MFRHLGQTHLIPFRFVLKIERGKRAGVVEFEPGWDHMWRDPHNDE